MTLLADFLLGVAMARHHSTESQTVGAEGAAAVLAAQLLRNYNINDTLRSLKCLMCEAM